jgi:hypothetical protein
MSEINLVEEELWDHYSGLPNPLWYHYKKELTDGEDDTSDSPDLGTVVKEI